jgi:uncharacterized protein
MTTATIAVKGSASDDFPADYAIVHFGLEFNAPARSEALAGGNAVVAQLRESVALVGAGVREMKVQSFRVEETFNHVGPDRVREHSAWVAQVGGQLLVEPGTVPAAIAELIRTGVQTHQLTWHLDPDTRLQAHRAVRREAVADAREAANDFALALGADLGRLITLADPGLLGAAVFSNGPTRAATMARASSARASDVSWDGSVDIDTAMITISANVEASYEVTLP